MSEVVEKTPEARWKHLKENGTKLLVNLSSNELINDKPKWFDEERFAKAKAAIQKYFIGVSYSSFTGLLLILQLPDGLEPLLSTGNSKDIPSLYLRYLNTIIHIQSWYDDDVFNPETKGYKSIRQVRGMHKRVQQIMNEKFKVNDLNGKDRVWLNQYDVAMTQFAFIGLAMLFPHKSCMIAAQKEELESINYYWRVLGSLMGIEDEFNACQFDKYEDIREYMHLVFEHEYKDNFKKNPCEKGLEMTKAICVALHYFMPLITFNSLAHWWKDCFLFNGYEPEPLRGKEKLLDGWTRLSFNYLLKSEGFMRFSNRLHRKRFNERLKNKDKVYKKLQEQYKDDKTRTFYSDRVDYFVKPTEAETEKVGISNINPQETTMKNSTELNSTDKIDITSNSNNTANDDNNNNDNEQVYSKNNPVVASGCPFGYGNMSESVRVEKVASA